MFQSASWKVIVISGGVFPGKLLLSGVLYLEPDRFA